jgi:hypothetical protein
MQDNNRLQLPKTVRIRKVHGEAMLLDLKSQECFGLDEIGVAIWEGIGLHGDIERVIESLLNEYEVDRAILEDDVRSLVSEMLGHGLLVNVVQAPK